LPVSEDGKCNLVEDIAFSDRELVIFLHDRLGEKIFGGLQRRYPTSRVLGLTRLVSQPALRMGIVEIGGV
jgi:hypothetical protein